MSELLPLLARQPIFNRKMQVVAYELLCRSCDLNEYTADGGDMASSQVLLHTFTELSIHSVVGHHQAFINFTRTLLMTPPPFDRRQLVVRNPRSHSLCRHHQAGCLATLAPTNPLTYRLPQAFRPYIVSGKSRNLRDARIL
jgi:hypothetical protein